jgi:orotate phosphoribosyltransferase-like protein
MGKTDPRKLKREIQQQLRKQAVGLRKKGMIYNQIAEVVWASPEIVEFWL